MSKKTKVYVPPDVDNYVTDPPTHDADPPDWPYFRCGDGCAWHPEPTKRDCYQGSTNAPAQLVAKVFAGEPIERVLALRQLMAEYSGAFIRIFAADCRVCGRNHQRGDGKKWARVAEAVHEGAIPALRAAKPAMRRIMDVRILRPGGREEEVPLPKPLVVEPKVSALTGDYVEPRVKVKKARNLLVGLPYCEGNPQLTLMAQLAFAQGIEMLKAKPVPVYSPRMPPPMFRLPKVGGRPRNDGRPAGWRPPPGSK